ncbi:NAD(P)H-dependent flavin oxidoreductase [Paenibacillus sp. FSL K6-0108]|uniref:NAD(P)H-dependent flavin oxidoreductase n=1 Tax=Paenibacillus sp. FSL K6-0108 TaxID=2921417 RepID=UPI00324E6B52
MTIVPLIVDAVSVPVLATGGIVDKRGVNAAFALGAEGVYLGTLFIASEESPAHERTKRAIVEYGAEDLVLLKTEHGGFWRSIPNALALETVKLDAEGGRREKPIGDLKTAMLDGNFEDGIITVSNGIEFIKEIKSCKAIVEELTRDIRSLIRQES